MENTDQIDEDLLNEALNGYDDDEKLNLTTDAKGEDEEIDPELEKEFQQILKSLNQEGAQGEEDMMKQFSSLMSGLLEELRPENGNGVADPNAEGGQGEAPEARLKSMLENLVKGEDDKTFELVAQNLLQEFIDKDVLQEPLLDAKRSYERYLEENKAKLHDTDLHNYMLQYNCIIQLLDLLEKEPENKEKMMNIFEKMSYYGSSPEGILDPLQNVRGDFNTLGQANGFSNGLSGLFSPKNGQKPAGDCNIF